MTRCISTMSRNYCKELVKSIIIKLITFRGLESARIWSTFQLFSFCVFFSCFKANTHLKRQHSAILASHLLLIRGDFSMKSDRSHQHVPYVQTQSGKRGLSRVFISFERQKPWGSPSNSWSNKQTIQAVSGTSSRIRALVKPLRHHIKIQVFYSSVGTVTLWRCQQMDASDCCHIKCTGSLGWMTTAGNLSRSVGCDITAGHQPAWNSSGGPEVVTEVHS